MDIFPNVHHRGASEIFALFALEVGSRVHNRQETCQKKRGKLRIFPSSTAFELIILPSPTFGGGRGASKIESRAQGSQ